MDKTIKLSRLMSWVWSLRLIIGERADSHELTSDLHIHTVVCAGTQTHPLSLSLLGLLDIVPLREEQLLNVTKGLWEQALIYKLTHPHQHQTSSTHGHPSIPLPSLPRARCQASRDHPNSLKLLKLLKLFILSNLDFLQKSDTSSSLNISFVPAFCLLTTLSYFVGLFLIFLSFNSLECCTLLLEFSRDREYNKQGFPEHLLVLLVALSEQSPHKNTKCGSR